MPRRFRQGIPCFRINPQKTKKQRIYLQNNYSSLRGSKTIQSRLHMVEWIALLHTLLKYLIPFYFYLNQNLFQSENRKYLALFPVLIRCRNNLHIYRAVHLIFTVTPRNPVVSGVFISTTFSAGNISLSK